jgi:serine/threonine protein kinase
LDHPNICTIYDLDEVDGVHFIAMQFVEGKNVRQLVAGRPLELKTTLLIGLQVADALAAAHSRGIIHRDIKSGNVMVTSSGQVKVLDFGLAKLLDDTEAATAGIHRTELTEVGVPYGTATYAAPEQARGDRVDKRADIFSTRRVALRNADRHLAVSRQDNDRRASRGAARSAATDFRVALESDSAAS